MLTALMLTLAAYQPNTYIIGGNTNEGIVHACITQCQAWADRPSYELKACVAKCQELGER